MDEEIKWILSKLIMFMVIMIGMAIIMSIWGFPYRPHLYEFIDNARNGSASIMGFRVI